MTASERSFLTRKARYEQPAQATGGKKGGGILGALLGGMVGGGASVPITADQGPLPGGGNLGQPGLTPTYTGGEGNHFLTLGNPNREQIKLGRFFKPRVNQEAAAALAADPLAPVQLEQPTTGVGGFFRRMFGDNANERNAALAEQQGQLRLQKWLMDQQTQGRMGMLDKEHQYAMERVRAQIEADNTRQANSDQTALQRLRLQDQNNLGLEGLRAVNDLIGKSQDQSFRARQSALDRDITTRGQDINADVAQLHYGQTKDVMPPGWGRIEGQTLYPDPTTGEMKVFTGVMPAQGGLDLAARQHAKALNDAKLEQNEIEKLQQPGTVLGGIGTVASDVGGAISGAVGKAAPYVPGLSGLSALGEEKDRLFNYFRRIASEKKARELMKRGLVNPIPTTE